MGILSISPFFYACLYFMVYSVLLNVCDYPLFNLIFIACFFIHRLALKGLTKNMLTAYAITTEKKEREQ